MSSGHANDRVTAGTGVSEPTFYRSVDLNNELQLLFVCSKGRCSYRRSIPQIVRGKREFRCICQPYLVYHEERQIYAWPVVDGGCGVCFHELDSLTYAHQEIAKTASEDNVWLCLRRKAMKVCEWPGILKYRLN